MCRHGGKMGHEKLYITLLQLLLSEILFSPVYLHVVDTGHRTTNQAAGSARAWELEPQLCPGSQQAQCPSAILVVRTVMQQLHLLAMTVVAQTILQSPRFEKQNEGKLYFSKSKMSY